MLCDTRLDQMVNGVTLNFYINVGSSTNSGGFIELSGSTLQTGVQQRVMESTIDACCRNKADNTFGFLGLNWWR